MTTRTWLLLNAALLILAGISVKTLISTPEDILKQHRQTAQAMATDKNDNGPTARAKAGIATRKAAATTLDTWPKIRRGSLQNIWKMSLFSPDRTEEPKAKNQDVEATQEEEELPAPPDFELIGILAANNARVAIIELKAAGTRRQQRVGYYKGRRQRIPQPPQPDKKADDDAFTPSFVTVHEDQALADSGYRVKHINKVDKVVILTKDSFDYKLAMDQNSSHAAKRKDSQVTYATSVKERIRAQQEKQQAAQKKQQQASQKQATQEPRKTGEAPPKPGVKYVPHTPMRTRANVPVEPKYGHEGPQRNQRQATWGRANQRRIRPARQQ